MRNFIHKIIKFFDKLEDKVRAVLSRHPIIYTFIGGVGIVLFWKGVWETADLFPFLNGPVSIIISVVMLLMTGLFVSFFIGERIIISGLNQEKKFFEKTEDEIRGEKDKFIEIEKELKEIEKDLEEIKAKK